MGFPRQRHRHRRRDQVVIFKRAFVVAGIGELRRWFDIGDQGRAALHQRDLGAARIQVLRDIVTTVAGTDHDCLLALPALAVVIAAGMHQRTGEVFQAGNFRHVRNAADAGRHDHMARTHGAFRAVGRPQHHRPAAFSFVVAAADELGAGPEIQLQALDISLEPVGKLVLRNIDRPIRRERHIGHVIDLHLVVQRQGMIALAPVVADALLAVDDQRIDPQRLQPGRDRQPGMAAADHQHVRIAAGIFDLRLAQVEPVRAAKIPRIGFAARPLGAELFLKTLELAEFGQQRPGF